MKKIVLAVLFAMLTVFVGAQLVMADVYTPTMTNVYFTVEGEPYEGNVDFTVECYGYEQYWDDYGVTTLEPGTYTPEMVYSYSASCPEYGCSIYESYYTSYRHIDYCNLTADTDDGEYDVYEYATRPNPDCEYISQYDWSDGDGYYEYTDGYDDCIASTSDYMGCMDSYSELIDEEDLMLDENGYSIERTCTLEVDLVDDAGGPGYFSDYDIMHQNYDAINYVKEQGIVEGYDDGTYKPDNQINRAEFTKILVETVYEEEDIDSCIENYNDTYQFTFGGHAFTDVGDDEWYSKYICMAVENGIVQGYDDGTYGPGNNINFVEAAKIIVNALDYNVSEIGEGEPWYKPYVDTLEFNAAIPTTIEGYDSLITRGEMAEMIYRLKEGIWKSTVTPSVDWE